MKIKIGDGAPLNSAAHPHTDLDPAAIEDAEVEIPAWVIVQRLAQHLHEVASHEEDRLLSYLANGIATHADHMRKKGSMKPNGLMIGNLRKREPSHG